MVTKTTTKRKPKNPTRSSTEVKKVKKLAAEGKLQPGHVMRLGTYTQKKAGTSPAMDKKLKAMRPGYRVSESGKVYFENRSNRSDTPKQRHDYIIGHRHSPRAKSARRSHIDVHLPTGVEVVPAPLKTVTGKEPIYYKPTSKKEISSAKLEKLIKTEMLKIHDKSIEYSFTVDNCGNLLGYAKGNFQKVRATVNVEKINGAQTYLIMVHNHPGDEKLGWYGHPPHPFSAQDIWVQTMYGINEIRVASFGKQFILKILDFDLMPHSSAKSTISRWCNKCSKTAQESVKNDDRMVELVKKEREVAESPSFDSVKYNELVRARKILDSALYAEYLNSEYDKFFNGYKDGKAFSYSCRNIK